MKKLGAAILLAALLAAAGCGDDSTTTTTPAAATTPSPTTDTFANTVGPFGTASRTFVVASTGAITVTLTSESPLVNVGLGMGVPIPSSAGGPGCALTIVQTTTAGANPQISTTGDAGNYCVAVFDLGNSPATGINFSVSIFHP